MIGILLQRVEPFVAPLIAEFAVGNGRGQRCFRIGRESAQPRAPRVAHSLPRRLFVKERVDLSTFRLQGIAGVHGHNEVKLKDRPRDRNVKLGDVPDALRD